MKNKILLFSASYLLWINCFGQVKFQKVINTNGASIAFEVHQTNDGGFIIAGYGEDIYENVCLIKTNQAGDTIWTKTYGGNNFDQGYSVQQTNDSGYIIAGYTLSTSNHPKVYLIKTGINGDTLWTKAYGGDSIDVGSYVQQTNDGGFIICGSTFSFGAGSEDIYLIKTNVNGDITWTKTYGGSGKESANCVQQTLDSGYIICGSTASLGADSSDVYLIKTNATGDTLWTKIYSGVGDDQASFVRQTIDGGYVVVGSTNSFLSKTYAACLIKTKTNGDTLWTKTYGGSGHDVGSSIQQTNDSGYIITGSTHFGAGSNDVYLVKTNSNGDTLWTKAYGGTASDVGVSLEQTRDGGFIIAGIASSFNIGRVDHSIYLIKTDLNGISECNQNATNTVVSYAPFIVNNANTIVYNGGIASFTNTVIGSGGKDSMLCLSVGVNELRNNNAILLYPNPATSELRIKITELKMKNPTIYITNVIVQEASPPTPLQRRGEDASIDVSKLSPGIYFIRLVDEKNSWVGKFVKE